MEENEDLGVSRLITTCDQGLSVQRPKLGVELSYKQIKRTGEALTAQRLWPLLGWR